MYVSADDMMLQVGLVSFQTYNQARVIKILLAVIGLVDKGVGLLVLDPRLAECRQQDSNQ